MIHQCPDRRASQRGSSLVEAALIYTSFLVLLVGTVDLGHVVFVHQSIVERARMAVRYGASRDASSDLDARMKNIVLYSTPTPADQTRPSFGLKADDVRIDRTQGVGEDPDQITVTVAAYTFEFLTPFVSSSHIGRTVSVTLPMEAP